MSLTEKFINWCHSPSATARFERTVVQAVLSVLATQLPQWLSTVQLPDWVNAIIVPSVMAILSIVMAEIGKNADDIVPKDTVEPVLNGPEDVQGATPDHLRVD